MKARSQNLTFLKKKKFNISMSKRLSVGWDKDDSYLQYIKIVH